MVAVGVLETPEIGDYVPERYLRLVSTRPAAQPLRYGPSLQRRRAVRTRSNQRRRRGVVTLVLFGAFAILAMPGHVFGATTGAGLSGDLANSSVLASGMDYVVQPGDTLNSISAAMNPVDPSIARSLLVHELGSKVVVPGEHVLIP